MADAPSPAEHFKQLGLPTQCDCGAEWAEVEKRSEIDEDALRLNVPQVPVVSGYTLRCEAGHERSFGADGKA